MVGREKMKPARVVMAALLTLSLTLTVAGTVLADDGEEHGGHGGSVQIQIKMNQGHKGDKHGSDDTVTGDLYGKHGHDDTVTGDLYGKHEHDDTVTDGLYGKHGSDDTVTDGLYGKHGSDDTVTDGLYGKHGSDDTVTGSLYGKGNDDQAEQAREAEVEQQSLKQAAKLRKEGHQEAYLIFVNGQTLNLTPVAHEGHTLVPFRRLAEYLGAQVSWDPSTKSVVMTLGSTTVQLNVHDQTVTINGQTKPLQTPAEIDDGTTYVPLRLIAEALGAKVSYDPVTGAITIVTPPSTTPSTTPSGTGTTGTGTTGTGTTGTGTGTTGTGTTGTGTGTTGTGTTGTGTTGTGTTGTGTTGTTTTTP